MHSSYKIKYLKYKTKYLELKKQVGGDITQVFEYLENIKSKISSSEYEILFQFAASYLESDSNTQITVNEFITNVKSLYNINLPSPSSPVLLERPIQRPIVMAAAAVAESYDNKIIVYTTGIAYFEQPQEDRTKYIKALIENVVETCRVAGKTVEFIHYDMFEKVRPRYYDKETFIKGYLTPDIIKREISNKPNTLLIDMAHIILYYKPYESSSKRPGKVITIYHEPNGTPSPERVNESESLNINSFYPGFIGDMINTDFVRNFRFFRIEGRNIITFIQKGCDKELSLKGRYRDYPTVFYEFKKHFIDIFSLAALANTKSTREINSIFW
jgi:hypothetical protein